MIESGDILLSLVRSALWNVPVESVPSDVKWENVFRLARQQTLLGLLADGLQKLPSDRMPDIMLVRKLKSYVVKNIQAHSFMTDRLGQTLQALRDGGVEPVLLKGHGLALNYPNPMIRQCGDVDFYVGKEGYSHAVQVCLGRFGKGDHELVNLKHYHFDNQGITIELHKIAAIIPSLLRNARFQKWTVDCMRSSELRKVEMDGVQVLLPSHRFDAIYIMVHAWHHFLEGGVGLRQLCDWTMYIHQFHANIDVDVLKADLKAFGLTRVWHLFSWIAVNELGLPSHECPLYSGKYAGDAEKMMDIIWGDGNFGRYSERNSKSPEGYVGGKLHSMKVTIRRFFRIMPVYPSQVLSALVLYFLAGIYQFLRGLIR